MCTFEKKELKTFNLTIMHSTIQFSELLTLIFITLKLLDKINWSWFWVLSPVLIPTAIILYMLIFIVRTLGKLLWGS